MHKVAQLIYLLYADSGSREEYGEGYPAKKTFLKSSSQQHRQIKNEGREKSQKCLLGGNSGEIQRITHTHKKDKGNARNHREREERESEKDEESLHGDMIIR